MPENTSGSAAAASAGSTMLIGIMHLANNGFNSCVPWAEPSCVLGDDVRLNAGGRRIACRRLDLCIHGAFRLESIVAHVDFSIAQKSAAQADALAAFGDEVSRRTGLCGIAIGLVFSDRVKLGLGQWLRLVPDRIALPLQDFLFVHRQLL